jgi:hypothetical protein
MLCYFEPTAGHRDEVAFEPQFFDFGQADIEAEIEPDRTRDDLDWREAQPGAP